MWMDEGGGVGGLFLVFVASRRCYYESAIDRRAVEVEYPFSFCYFVGGESRSSPTCCSSSKRAWLCCYFLPGAWYHMDMVTERGGSLVWVPMVGFSGVVFTPLPLRPAVRFSQDFLMRRGKCGHPADLPEL